MENKVLTGKDIYAIKDTGIVRTYNHTSEDSPLKGKKYSVFAFADKAFAVREGDTFIDDLKKGNVEEVTIGVDEEGQWTLMSHLNTAQAEALDAKEIRQAKKIGAIKYYSSANFKPSAVTNPEELATL